MHKPATARWILLAVVLPTAALVLPAAARAQSDDGKSAYDELDTRKLAEKLSQMGMNELLDALIERERSGAADPLDVQKLRAEALIGRGRSAAVGERDDLLRRAAPLMEEIVKSLKGDSQPERVLEYYSYKLRLAQLWGVWMTEPYAQRLIFLTGGASDRQRVIELTSRALPLLDELRVEIPDTLETWRGDMKMLVVEVPELEDFRRLTAYRGAWIRFYRGLALPEGDDDRRRLLREAILAVAPFVSGETATGVKHWSQLLTGMARMERHDHDGAEEMFRLVASPDVKDVSLRLQAMFVSAKNLVEKTRFEHDDRKASASEVERGFSEAMEGIANFHAEGMELLGETGAMKVDFNRALLLHYCCETWASCVEEDKAKLALEVKAQQALLEFATKYRAPGVQDSFFDIIYQKYRDRKDAENLNSMILLAVAGHELAEGTPEDVEHAIARLEEIRSRKDEISRMVMPMALWRLAIARNERRENVPAGELFLRIARDYPQHELAPPAARNAVISYHGVIRERESEGKAVSWKMRLAFIEALELLLTRRGDDPETAEWWYDLGWQHERVALEEADWTEQVAHMLQAVVAYEKTPSGQPEYMQARYMALRLRAKLLDESASPEAKDPANREAAGLLRPYTDTGTLRSKLLEYSRTAAEKARQATGAEKSELMRWGAEAAFQASVIEYDNLGMKAEALGRIALLPSAWPGTPVLRSVAEFEIRKLVEQGEVGQAIEKVENFRRQYPDEASELLSLVLENVRGRIGEMHRRAEMADELKRYREVYLSFARDLYTRAEQSQADPQQLYRLRQMYADALLENAQADEALELFQKCAAEDEAQRTRETHRIEQEFEGKRRALAAAGRNVPRLEDLAESHRKQALQLGLAETAEMAGLRHALRQLKETEDVELRRRKAADVTRALKAAYDSLEQAIRNSLPVDANNVRGLARCYRAKKQYADALKQYLALVRGLDASRHPTLYWEAQLEYCQTVLEGFAGDKDAMERLLIRIRQLQLEDGNMGGLRGKFMTVAAGAREAAKSATK